MIELFWDGKEEVFYDTGRDHEQLILRPRDLFDHAIPCGGSAATALLLRMAIISGDSQYFMGGSQSRVDAGATCKVPHEFCQLAGIA